MLARRHGGIQGQSSKIFLCPEKFVLNIYHNENKNLATLTVYFAHQNCLQVCLMPAYTFKLVTLTVQTL